MILTKIKAIFNPEQYQGWTKTKSYFEGWYFKVVNQDETKAFAFIPGVAMNRAGEKQAFIQILDGKKFTSEYHKFDFRTFQASPDSFKIEIGNNTFSANALQINLPELTASLQFSGNVPWPKHWYSPGIMGPYSFLPFMECYHGIVSMDNSINGTIELKGEALNFDGGRGYTEKDWGHSFPSSYVWLQTNHFTEPGISLKVSVAKIPWMGYSFVGFIAGVWLGNQLIQFTTYNRSRLRKSVIDTEKVELIMENTNFRLEVQVKREKATALASPILGLMDGRIEESMNVVAQVKLVNRRTGITVLHDSGRNAAMEVAGKIEELILPV